MISATLLVDSGFVGAITKIGLTMLVAVCPLHCSTLRIYGDQALPVKNDLNNFLREYIFLRN